MNHSTYEFGDSFQCKRVFLSFPHCERVDLTKLFIIFIVKILYGMGARLVSKIPPAAQSPQAKYLFT